MNIKIQVKKTKVDSLFDSISQAILKAKYLVRNIGLEVHDHPHPYPLGWENKNVELRVTK